MLTQNAMIGAIWLGQLPSHIQLCVVELVREHGPEASAIASQVHANSVGAMPMLGFIPNYTQAEKHADLARGVQCWLRDAMVANWDPEKIKLVLQRTAGITDAHADTIAKRIWTPDKGPIDFVTTFVRDLPDIPLTSIDDVLKGKFASVMAAVTNLALPELASESTDNLFQARMLGKELGILLDRALDMSFQDMYTGKAQQLPKDGSGSVDWGKLASMATAVLPAALGGVARLIGSSTAVGSFSGRAASALSQGGGRSVGLLPAGSAAGSGMGAGVGNYVAAGDAGGYDEGDMSIENGQETIGDISDDLETILQTARGGEIHPNALANALSRVAQHPGLDAETGDFLSDAAGMVGGLFGGSAGEKIAKGAAGMLSSALGKRSSKPRSSGPVPDDELRRLAREGNALGRKLLSGQQGLMKQVSGLIALNSGQYRKVLNQLGLLTRAGGVQTFKLAAPRIEPEPDATGDVDPVDRALAL